MSPGKSGLMLQVRRRFSLQFAILLLCIHCLLSYALFLLPVSITYQLLAVLLVLFNFFNQWQRLHFRNAGAVRSLEYCGDGQWRLQCGDGHYNATLASSPVVTAWMLVLEFVASDNSKHPVYLFNDSSDNNSLRRLRVLLRLSPHAAIRQTQHG